MSEEKNHGPAASAPGERAPGERAPGERAPGERAPGERAPGERQPIGGPLAWRGQELLDRPGWLHELTGDERAEIASALAASRSLDPEAITAERFPLPDLGRRLARARHDLEHETGSFLLRGWSADAHSLDDNERVFRGLASHLGTPLSQSARGETVFHVADAGFRSGDQRARGPNTRKGLSFHCDRCDVIGFSCIRQARSGGESYLVSSITVHDEILRRRPDLLEELYQPWYYETHNVDLANDDPWCRQPIFALEQGHFVGYILRVLIDRAYRRPDLPDMTPRQKEALDLVESICAEPELHHRFLQQPGDMLFVNNFTNFHSRSEFEDHEDPAQKRLLLRIWLSMPNSRPLPDAFAGSFGRTGAGELRGGIHPA